MYRYTGEHEYKAVCKALRMLPDVRAGVPRGANEGIVLVTIQNTAAYIAPRVETVAAAAAAPEGEIDSAA
jgi:hypothetical protein